MKCAICQKETDKSVCSDCNMQALIAYYFKNLKYVERMRQISVFGSYMESVHEKQE